MQIDGLKKKVYVAVVGMPDCGKSTFIKGIVKHITQRDVPIDSFCNEQQLDMTIRSAQVFLRDKMLPYDIVFLDCPGHIFEFADEAESVLSKAHMCIHIINDKQDEVTPYNKFYENCNKWKQQLNKLQQKLLPTLVLHSHSDKANWMCYDAYEDARKFNDIYAHLIAFINKFSILPVDPIETALRIIRFGCEKVLGKKALMCSYGKDSILMLQLLKMVGHIDDVNIEYPNSGFDLPGISEQFKTNVQKFFGCKIVPFNVVKSGWDFNNHSVQDIMMCKAKMLSERLANLDYKACFVGIRRDEEGTRAKEKFFSPRKLDGSFDMLAPQKEMFMDEFDESALASCDNIRINPLLDLCEADVWYATKHFKLPVCSEYFSKDGLRYRSLGDWPTTTPLQSEAADLQQICEEVDNTTIPERACRQLQDNSTKYGMEKLRKAGFF